MAHTHKLKKHTYKNGTAVYFCLLNCNYKIEVSMADGKEVLCNICGEKFTMTVASIKQAKPHCTNCGKVMVKDENGKRTYVSKDRMKFIASDLAKNKVADLRAKLSSVITMERDEDI